MSDEILDTSNAQLEAYYALLRSLSPARRAEILVSLCNGVRAVSEAGIRQAHPGISDDEVEAELTARLYGEAVARRLHRSSPLPER